MKIKFLLFIPFFFIAVNCFGQTTFQRVLFTGLYSEAYAVRQTTDGGYIIAGLEQSPDTSYFDAYLIKTNKTGDTVWTRTYGGTGFDAGYCVQQTTDGGYILAGTTNSFGLGGDIYIIKTNASGDTLWTSTYGGTSVEDAYFIVQTKDGGYIISGDTYSYGDGNEDAYLVKIDAAGGLTWGKSYGGPGNEAGYCVSQTSDSGYIICGYTTSFGADSEDVYLIRTKANGDTLWTKTYGGVNNEIGYFVEQTADSGYILAGSTTSFGAGNADVYLIKTNANGDTTWTKTYGGINDDVASEVHKTSDGGYIIPSITASFGVGLADAYLIKTDAMGDTLWTRTYGTVNSEVAYSGNQTADGGYIMAGATNDFDSVLTGGAIYLIKTDANGNSGCYEGSPGTIVSATATIAAGTQTIIFSGGTAGATATIIGSGANDSALCLAVGINELSNASGISLFPNPAGNQLTVYGLQFPHRVTITIYNMLGELLRMENRNSGTSESIDVSALSTGIYFVRVADENESWVGKFVKE